MIAGDARDSDWLASIPKSKRAIVVMEGVSMYLTLTELKALTENLCAHFEQIALLLDCYTIFAAKMSKYKNPINDVGVTEVYGIDDPKLLENGELAFVSEHNMTPENLIDELSGMEKHIFRIYVPLPYIAENNSYRIVFTRHTAPISFGYLLKALRENMLLMS